MVLVPAPDAVPGVRSRLPGRPRKRPDRLHADKGHDHRRCCAYPGRHRRVVERRFARLARSGASASAIEGLDAASANTGFMGIQLCLVALRPGRPAGCDHRHPAHRLRAVWRRDRADRVEPAAGAEPVACLGQGRLLACVQPAAPNPTLDLAAAAARLALPAPVLHFTTLPGAAANPSALITIGLFPAQPRARPNHHRPPGWPQAPAPARDHRDPRLWAVPHAAAVVARLPAAQRIADRHRPFMLAKLYDREAAVTSRAILWSTVL